MRVLTQDPRSAHWLPAVCCDNVAAQGAGSVIYAPCRFSGVVVDIPTEDQGAGGARGHRRTHPVRRYCGGAGSDHDRLDGPGVCRDRLVHRGGAVLGWLVLGCGSSCSHDMPAAPRRADLRSFSRNLAALSARTMAQTAATGWGGFLGGAEVLHRPDAHSA